MLHFLVWVDGEQTLDEWVDARYVDDPTALAYRHAEQALASGRPWCVEVVDPDGELPTIRFGTDRRRMTMPVALADGTLGLLFAEGLL